MPYLLVLCPALLHYGDNYWNNSIFVKWYLLALLLIVCAAFYLGKKIHDTVVVAYLSTAGAAIWYLGWRDHQYASFQAVDIFAINKQAAYVLVAYTLGLIYFARAGRRELAQMKRAFAWLCGVGSATVIFRGFVYGERGFDAGGLLGNSSMNACMLAVTAPLLVRLTTHQKMGWLWGLLPVGAVLVSGRSAPLIALALSLGVYLYRVAKPKYLVPALLFGAGCVAVFLATSDKRVFLDDSNRLIIWGGVFREMLRYPHGLDTGLETHTWLFGIGPGVSAALVPHLQQTLNLATCCGWWIWLHNDWLQLFVEQGALGVVCYAPLVYCVGRQAVSRPELFASVVSFAFVMAVNYPLRLATGALFAGFLVTAVLKQDEDGYLCS